MVLCYEQPVVKIKESFEIKSAIMVMIVLDRSVSDVGNRISVLVFDRLL